MSFQGIRTNAQIDRNDAFFALLVNLIKHATSMELDNAQPL